MGRKCIKRSSTEFWSQGPSFYMPGANFMTWQCLEEGLCPELFYKELNTVTGAIYTTHTQTSVCLLKTQTLTITRLAGALESRPFCHENSLFKFSTKGYPGARTLLVPQNGSKLIRIFNDSYHVFLILLFPWFLNHTYCVTILSSSLVLLSFTVKVHREMETQLHLHRYDHWPQSIFLSLA